MTNTLSRSSSSCLCLAPPTRESTSEDETRILLDFSASTSSQQPPPLFKHSHLSLVAGSAHPPFATSLAAPRSTANPRGYNGQQLRGASAHTPHLGQNFTTTLIPGGAEGSGGWGLFTTTAASSFPPSSYPPSSPPSSSCSYSPPSSPPPSDFHSQYNLQCRLPYKLIEYQSKYSPTSLFNRYASHLLTALFLLFLSILLQAFVTTLVDTAIPMDSIEPLPDRMHSLFGETPPSWASVSVLNILCLCFFIIFAIRFVFLTHWAFSFAVFTRVSLVLAIMYCLKGLTTIFTSIPSSSAASCKLVGYNTPKMEEVALEAFFWRASIFLYRVLFFIVSLGAEGCSYTLISGHSIFVSTLLCGWFQYNRQVGWLLLALPFCVIYPLMTASLLHYSVGVFVGSVLTTLLWGVYHYLVVLGAARFYLQGSFGVGLSIDDLHPSVKSLSMTDRLIYCIIMMEGLDYRLEHHLEGEQIEQIKKAAMKSKASDSASSFPIMIRNSVSTSDAKEIDYTIPDNLIDKPAEKTAEEGENSEISTDRYTAAYMGKCEPEMDVFYSIFKLFKRENPEKREVL